MGTTARFLTFLAAAFLAVVFAQAYKYHGAPIDAYLRTTHLHAMDWLLLLLGSFVLGSIAYGLLTEPDKFDWRAIIWLIMGGFMIYAALGNNASLKETACQLFVHRHYTPPCYH
jgi:hypothetical protein